MPKLPQVQQTESLGMVAPVEQTSAMAAKQGIDQTLDELVRKDQEDLQFEALDAQTKAQSQKMLVDKQLRDKLEKDGNTESYLAKKQEEYDKINQDAGNLVAPSLQDKYELETTESDNRSKVQDIDLVSQINAEKNMAAVTKALDLTNNQLISGKINLDQARKQNEKNYSLLQGKIPLKVYSEYKRREDSKLIRSALEVELEENSNSVFNKLESGKYDKDLTDEDKRALMNLTKANMQTKVSASKLDGEALEKGYQANNQLTRNFFLSASISKNPDDKNRLESWGYLSKFSEEYKSFNPSDIQEFVRKNNNVFDKNPTLKMLFLESAEKRANSVKNMDTYSAMIVAKDEKQIPNLDPYNKDSVSTFVSQNKLYKDEMGIGNKISLSKVPSFVSALENIKQESNPSAKIQAITSLASNYNISPEATNTFFNSLKDLEADDSTVGISSMIIESQNGNDDNKNEATKAALYVTQGADFVASDKSIKKDMESSISSYKQKILKLVGTTIDSKRIDSMAKSAFYLKSGSDGDYNEDEAINMIASGKKAKESLFFTGKDIVDSDTIIPMNMNVKQFENTVENIDEDYLKNNSYSIDKYGNLNKEETYPTIDGKRLNLNNFKNLSFKKIPGQRNIYSVQTSFGTTIKNNKGSDFYIGIENMPTKSGVKSSFWDIFS